MIKLLFGIFSILAITTGYASSWFFIKTPSGGAFVPTDIASLTFWVSAKTTTDLYTDTGCTTNATTDGDIIKCWKDKSGNNRKATDSSGTTYDTGTISGNPSLYFQNDVLTTDATLSQLFTSSDLTAFVVVSNHVYNTNASDGTIYNNAAIWTDSGAQFGFMLQQTTNNVAYGNGSLAVVKTTVAVDTPAIMMMRITGGNMYISKNGGAESSVSITALSFTGGNVVRIGKNFSASTVDSWIGEIAFFDAGLSSGDITSMYDYLNTEWSVY
jgi:hypothetical protein